MAGNRSRATLLTSRSEPGHATACASDKSLLDVQPACHSAPAPAPSGLWPVLTTLADTLQPHVENSSTRRTPCICSTLLSSTLLGMWHWAATGGIPCFDKEVAAVGNHSTESVARAKMLRTAHALGSSVAPEQARHNDHGSPQVVGMRHVHSCFARKSLNLRRDVQPAATRCHFRVHCTKLAGMTMLP